MSNLIPIERVERRIYLIRGQKVMLDRDIAELYEAATKVLKQAVKRNMARFPEDFMFELTNEEFQNWRSQFVTSNSDKIGLRWKPFAFTEQGIAMLSGIIQSSKAVQVNIAIMRAFVRIRQMIFTHKDLAQKFKELEGRVGGHDQQIRGLFDAIQKILEIEEKPKNRIGFI
ncbi:MAG: ORF6N domain-containing protein [Candidatus Saganbacteria bacterium]|nr:ORF6N domain-containing protein [Candidatus Saganbacteria bacterium]